MTFVALGLSFFTETSQAQDLIPVEAFAKLPLAEDLKLSPNGELYAGIMTIEGTKYFAVIPTNGGREGLQLIPFGNLTHGFWHWTGNKYIVVSISVATRRFGVKNVETRLSTIDVSTGETHPTIKIRADTSTNRNKHIPQFQSTVISYLLDDDEHILMQLDTERPHRYDVVKVKLKDGTYEKVVKFKSGARTWKADAKGQVRMGYGYPIKNNGDISDQFRVLFRADENEEFRHIDALEDKENPYSPVTFTEDPHIIIVEGENEHGRSSLYKFDTRTEEMTEVLFSDELYGWQYIAKSQGSDKIFIE